MAEKSPGIGDGTPVCGPRETGCSEPPHHLALWQLKWLQVHRPRLLLVIQSIVPEILDQLVSKGDIDPLESRCYQQIMSEHTVAIDKARRLLDWLLGQPPGVFWHLQEALGSLLSPDVAAEFVVGERDLRTLTEMTERLSLSERTCLTFGEAVRKARDKLVRFYRMASEQPIVDCRARGRKERSRMSLEEMFVNISILSAVELGELFRRWSFGTHEEQRRAESFFGDRSVSTATVVALGNLFKAEEREGGEENEEVLDPERVLAAGGAGCGKSVCFTRKAPHDWATGKLWQQFALFFCLKLRDKSVWKAKTVAELLKLAHLGLNEHEQGEVVAFVEQHPEHVVVVCDGLDEANIEENSLVWELLQRSCPLLPPSLRVILTTRPCEIAGILPMDCFDRRVELTGFTRENIEEFARKFFNNATTSAKLLSEVAMRPSLRALMQTPFFMFLVCEQFKEKEALPDRKTTLFQSMVIRLLQRYAAARGLRPAFASLRNAPESVSELAIALGKLAFCGLQKKQLYFTDIDLADAEIPASVLELGLLIEVESCDSSELSQYTYSFSHLSVQEFLAALYVCEAKIQTAEDLKNLVQRNTLEGGHLRMFWCFLSGLLSADLVEAFLRLVSNKVFSDSWYRRPLTIPRDQHVPKTNLVHLHHLDLLCDVYHESCLSSSLTTSASVTSLLQKCVLSIDVYEHRMTCSLLAVECVFQAHRDMIKGLELHQTDDDQGVGWSVKLVTGLSLRNSLEIISITPREVFGVRRVDALRLAILRNCQTLKVFTGDLLVIEKLAPSLQRCQNLEELCTTGNVSSGVLNGLLPWLTQLQELDVNYAAVSWAWNKPLTDYGSLKSLSEAIGQCVHLRGLRFGNVQVSTHLCAAVMEIVIKLPSLKTLVIYSDNRRSDDFVLLASLEFELKLLHPELKFETITM